MARGISLEGVSVMDRSAAEELLRQEGSSSSSHRRLASFGRFSSGMKGDGKCPKPIGSFL
jgi:hypothetical protein